MNALDKEACYHYTDSGLDYIYLVNGFEVFHHPELGEGVAIHQLDALHTMILHYIIDNIPLIRGQEVRFMRAYLGLNQTQMGKLLGKDKRTIQRIEKERDKPIEHDVDSLLKMFIAAHMNGDNAAHRAHDILKQIKESTPVLRKKMASSVRMSNTSHGWQAAA